MQKVKRNRIKCLKCNDIIESTSEYDFKRCTCGSCAVDGGVICPRIIGKEEDWEDLSEYEE